MEPDMVVDMIESSKAKSVTVGTIVGNEDSTTIARVQEVDSSIAKKSDRNHLKKIVGNSLYKLQKKHKNLTARVIRYLQKCFSYMLSQNQGNPAGITKGLMAMFQHTFGDHSHCDSTWCRFLKTPDMKYCSLPHGRPLSGEELQNNVKSIFIRFQDQAEKLANLQSIQANESLNNVIASKAPQATHHSGSESLSYRVAAAVAQKNVGNTFVSKVSFDNI